MVRIEPIEQALPREWRGVVRDHPWLAISTAAIVGMYLGRNHGRRLLAAVAATAITAGLENAKRAVAAPRPKGDGRKPAAKR